MRKSTLNKFESSITSLQLPLQADFLTLLQSDRIPVHLLSNAGQSPLLDKKEMVRILTRCEPCLWCMLFIAQTCHTKQLCAIGYVSHCIVLYV